MAKANTIGHIKTYRLADLLDVELWAALGLMESFWDWCYAQAPDGDLSGFPLSMIAEGAKWRGKPKQLMHLLRVCELVDELEGGILYVHDLHDHAPDFVRRKLQRAGKPFANGFPARLPKGSDGKDASYQASGFDAPKTIPYMGGDATKHIQGDAECRNGDATKLHSNTKPQRVTDATQAGDSPDNDEASTRRRRDTKAGKPVKSRVSDSLRTRGAQDRTGQDRTGDGIEEAGTQLGESAPLQPDPPLDSIEPEAGPESEPNQVQSPHVPNPNRFKMLAEQAGDDPPDPEVEARRQMLIRQARGAA